MSLSASNDPDHYAPDHRLNHAYDEATLLDDAGIEALCPSYIELAETDARYRDDSLLGQGALKEVYRTYDCRTKRWVAMARLRRDRGPEFYDLFVHEAWLNSSLSHPNIIKIHDAGVDSEGRPFFTMDLKGNRTLSDLVRESKHSDQRSILQVFSKVCDAVAYAHSRGVIHLDLKPDNIQTDDFGEVLVCDWGLGKVIGELEEGEADVPLPLQPFDNMTLLGQIKGTPGFMAPEQAIPRSIKDHHTDIFSLGCVLHLILTGQPPFTGTPAAALDATTRANVVPPRMRFPQLNIPESLEAVVMKATARLPQDRYPSALDLQREIQNYLGGYSTRAENSGFFRETRLFLARNRIPAAITSLAFVILTILSVLFFQRLSDQRAATAQESRRASEYASEAETVSDLYQDELAQSLENRKQLAKKLATSANSLKNLGIFERPAKTVAEAHNLSSTALALDPSCEKALFERFSLNCITLNFRHALIDHPTRGRNFFSYVRFAEAFPNFSFGEKSRPTPDQLTGFFRKARPINPDSAALMERILSYDFATRRDHSSSDQILGAFLEYLNGGKKHLIASYDRQESSYFLWSDRDAQLLIPIGTGSGECVLRFLQLRTLKLDISGKFKISDLQLLPIEVLDVRDCDKLSINEAVSLPRLREIHVRSGQIDKELLRRRIQTSERLKIVETP